MVPLILCLTVPPQVLRAVVVRHPTERFISWYNDKIMGDSQSGALEHGAETFNFHLLGKGNWTVVRDGRNWMRRGAIVDADTRAYPPGAYVERLLRTSPHAVEKHLRSLTATCLLPLVRYDVVGRLENMTGFIEQLSAAAGGSPLHLPHLHGVSSDPAHARGKQPLWPMLHEANLSCETRDALLSAYREDLYWLDRLGVGYVSHTDAPCVAGRDFTPDDARQAFRKHRPLQQRGV